MADLFVALGYEQPRLNIHKSGRELDLSADHRLEPRHAIAECKATANPIGGDDLNKFVGTLDAESRANDKIIGYFISLSGFKQTAIEQERQRRVKIIILDGPQVVKELIIGERLIDGARAAEIAGRMNPGSETLSLDSEAELVAHERGWIWAVYYTQGKARTHIALIHADGTPLARSIADEVIAADQTVGGTLHALTCLNPALPLSAADDPHATEALEAYRRYIANECGFIQLDGLPSDAEVGSRRLQLEQLFVPLHLDLTVLKNKETIRLERKPIGSVLAEHPRLAILAAPGGGKSTLLKRLAVAYTDPERREQTSDDLPGHDWLPLFFRCRELRGLARGSFADIVESISRQELVRHYASSFISLVDHALLEGRILLLVDGLDEITDPGDRAAFVCTLRTALQAYPGVALVATSREAGFRHIAAHLAPICPQSTLSHFDNDDIRRLSVAWNQIVIGDTEIVRLDAEQLAQTIIQNDRIRRLAINPLLLTTLLLVKRTVGALPPRRAALYGESVKVLIRTWNTEGFKPLPEEETLPQLCYVASSMMIDGVQKISRPQLAIKLRDAREALPTELGYVQNTVDEFIDRVESRSSLLMMSGYGIEKGQVVEFFEFRHLTFQEFLAAQAMVKGWYPGWKEQDTLASVLEPYFSDEAWREVIPLAAVLGGRSTETLIQRLIGNELDSEESELSVYNSQMLALSSCLADEASARPETIRKAIRRLLITDKHIDLSWQLIAQGRYGQELKNEAIEYYFKCPIKNLPYYSVGSVEHFQITLDSSNNSYIKRFESYLDIMNKNDRASLCRGALGFAFTCREANINRYNNKFILSESDVIIKSYNEIAEMMDSIDLHTQAAALLCLAHAGRIVSRSAQIREDILEKLIYIWMESSEDELSRLAVWAFINQHLLPERRGSILSSVPIVYLNRIMYSYYEYRDRNDRWASLITAWYSRGLKDGDIAIRAAKLGTDPHDRGAKELKVLFDALIRK